MQDLPSLSHVLAIMAALMRQPAPPMTQTPVANMEQSQIAALLTTKSRYCQQFLGNRDRVNASLRIPVLSPELIRLVEEQTAKICARYARIM